MDKHKPLPYVLFLFYLFGIYLTSHYSFLVFHSAAELFSIVVGLAIFIISWNARSYIENNYLLFLGLAYFFVSLIDLIHMLAYKGMGVFQGFDADLPTQLWISARYIESFSLLIAPLFVKRRFNYFVVVMIYTAATSALLFSLFKLQVFPRCFIEGQGLTNFKKISEYVICIILIGSLLYLYRFRFSFESNIFRLIGLSIITTIFAELSFTFYISVYGLSNRTFRNVLPHAVF